MGIMAGAKASSVGKDARKAWESGQAFFTPILNFPTFTFGFSGAVTDWPPMIESITDEGWKLHTWALVTDKENRPQAMPLFTR